MVLFTSLAVQKRNLKAHISLQYIVKFNKSLNMNNLYVCIITSENNHKQYLVAFLRFFLKKELACSVAVHTFFDWMGNTVDKNFWQQHLNQYIN